MKEWDITEAMELSESPETRAHEHALDIAFMVAEEMELQGIGKKELAERMGVSLPRLSKLLNTQPNMTLETIARFELALNVELSLTFLGQAARVDNVSFEEQGQVQEVLQYVTLVPAQSLCGVDGENVQEAAMPYKKLRCAA